ncbi:MAG: glycoside hydrolase family 127 protein [Lachnospiraceae bacterium]|nr:glycoside hydrolase family 127 protein [Lachnospiraceae bacterium]
MRKTRGFRAALAFVMIAALLLTSVPASFLASAADASSETVTSDADLTDLEDFDLSEVLLTDDYYVNATNLEIDYLLSLETDRLLANFYQVAGLDNGAECYDGWEDSLIGGHTLGHYMTALAQAYENANSTDDQKAQLLTKITELVEGLKECQDEIGTGFIFGSTQYTISDDPEYQFDNVEKNLTNISTQAWVPWYTMHKILAGLISVAELTDADSSAVAAEALDVASYLGDWIYERTSSWTATIQARVLAIEYGGMNDALYDLYILTGEENYMTAAHMFDETDLFEKVANASAGDNVLDGLHANTTIPKFLGALKRYVITGEEEYLEYVEAFWTLVINDHTYVTGGNSEWEHFGADDVLDGERTNCNDETCNVYNMLKMSKLLYQITGEKKYMDYYENAFLNSIMSSQNPETGMTTYFQPMATGYFKVYSTETESFWCCTGSGMENFSKLQTSIYYHKDNYLIVNQFISSEVTFAEANAVVAQETDIPNTEETVFTVSAIDSSKSVDLDLALRIPDWAAGDVTILVNGTEYDAAVTSEGYAIVEGLSAGDTVSYTIPMEVVVYTLPDNENVFAFKYGPVVLSAELGTSNMTTGTTGVDVTIPLTKDMGDASSETIVIDTSLGITQEEYLANINDYLVRDESAEELTFTLTGTDTELTFTTHYLQYTQRYGIYWTIIADDDAIVSSQVIAQKETDRANETTTDSILIGYGQYENDEVHDMQDEASVGDTSGTVSAAETFRYAEAGGYFSYDMQIDEVGDYYLQAYFLAEDLDKTIQITVGDTVVFSGTVAQLAEKYGADTSDDIFLVEILLSESVVTAAAYTKTVTDGDITVITVTFESCIETDEEIVYFVDCGDYDVTTVSDGDALGTHNSVTEQIYGEDEETGYTWGIIDTVSDPLTNGSSSVGGVYTDWTWPNEWLSGDGITKEESNRYTKNQYEVMNSYDTEGTRYLDYGFELEAGTYEIEICLTNPWNCSCDPAVYLNYGTDDQVTITADAAVPSYGTAVITYTFTVDEDGVVTVDFRGTGSDTLAINVSYIIITQTVAVDDNAEVTDSARLCNLLSLRTAYSTNAELIRAEAADADNVTVDWDGGTEINITVASDVSSFDMYFAPADTYGYVTIDGNAIDDSKAKTLTVDGRTATYELVVYAEDHETSKTYTVNVLKDYEVDETIAYFVDCGDYDTSTVSEGDAFGTHNSLTEQIYGEDPVTGYSWGIVDTVSSSLTNGESGTGGVDTDWTWPYEYNSGDGLSKTTSNRYTKNQYESGIETRYLDYAFELENGTYTVEIGLVNPWNCSTNPVIYANIDTDSETVITENANAPSTVTATVEVTDGMLTLNFRGTGSSTLAINVAYIIIYEGETSSEEDETQYETIYFVDAGDYDVTTVSDGDELGTHNSVTEQVYGVDAETGYTWGIIDTVSDELANGTSGTGGVDTDWTWPYEANSGDGVDKTASNRYTKNQYESGISVRYLDYGFELEAGTYEIEIGLSNPWGCSDDPAVYLNYGTDSQITITDDAAVPDYGTQVITATFTVDEDGIITVDFRSAADDSNTLAINLCYIIIRQEVASTSSDTVDKSELEAAITSATSAYEDAVSAGTYTEESLQALADAIAALEALYEDEDATEEEIEVALAALEAALAGLEAAEEETGETETETEEETTEEETTEAEETETDATANDTDSTEEDTDGSDSDSDSTSTVTGDVSKGFPVTLLLVSCLVIALLAKKKQFAD